MMIKKLNMPSIIVVVAAICLLFAGATAHAALTGVGPILPLSPQYPTWYQDSLGVSLGPCWDYNGFCTLLPPFGPPSLGLGFLGTPISFDPTIPINSNNFPIETFYFDATAKMNLGPVAAGGKAAKFTLVIALEGSFGGLPAVPAPGTQTTFLRVNLRVAGTLSPNATYTVVEPYGTFTFTTDAAGNVVVAAAGQAFRAVDGCGAAPCDFTALLPAPLTNVGPFLVDAAGFHTDPVTGNIYIGPGPLAAVPVVNGPNGNIVTVTGPNAGGIGVAAATTNVFFLTGKMVGVIALVNAVPVLQPVSFPVQRPGVVSAPVVVTLSNPDKIAAATLGAFALTGANAADFTITADTCSGATLAAGTGTCTFTITFSEPIATAVNGAKSAVISFPNTAPASRPPTVINLAAAIDSIPPTVVATVPANNAINIPANNALTATFSEPVSGVSDTSFVLTGPSGTVTGTVVMDAASKVATFTPNADLQSNTTYTATLTGGAAGIADLVGNTMVADFVFSFVTTNPDKTPPSVLSTDPADNSTGARVDDPVTVTFNEAIQLNPLSVNATTFFLSEGVTGSVTFDPTTRTATLKPAKPLDFFHKYTATVTTGVKSLGGIPMTANFTFSFLTNGAPNAPKLYLPQDGATGVGSPVQFQWFKSKDIDAETVTYHLWYCTNPGFLGCTPVDIGGTSATASATLRSTLAGLGGYGAGMLLAGIAVMGGMRSRRKIFFFITVLAISGMVVTACGKKSSSSTGVDPNSIMTKSVEGLNPGSTYYWKVVADDGNGALVESETRTFATL